MERSPKNHSLISLRSLAQRSKIPVATGVQFERMLAMCVRGKKRNVNYRTDQLGELDRLRNDVAWNANFLWLHRMDDGTRTARIVIAPTQKCRYDKESAKTDSDTDCGQREGCRRLTVCVRRVVFVI